VSNENEKLLKEFSPQFVANGLSGMLASGEYEAVDVKFTFYRKAPPRETPPKKAESASQADNTGSPKLPPCVYCGPERVNELGGWADRGYNLCPYCGRQLRAGA